VLFVLVPFVLVELVLVVVVVVFFDVEALVDFDESDADESDAEESDADESDADESDAEDSDAEESDAEESDAEESPLAPLGFNVGTTRGLLLAKGAGMTGALVKGFTGGRVAGGFFAGTLVSVVVASLLLVDDDDDTPYGFEALMFGETPSSSSPLFPSARLASEACNMHSSTRRNARGDTIVTNTASC
jgi:hypothetical protein